MSAQLALTSIDVEENLQDVMLEYLFGCDVLLSTTGHVPRHSKSYRNFLKEFERLQKEREDAFQEFYDDVQSGAFPEKKHIVEINEKELDNFLNNLEKR